MTIAERATTRIPDATVQLGTRISPASRQQLMEVVAAEHVNIRTVIEDAILERWTRLGTGESSTVDQRRAAQ